MTWATLPMTLAMSVATMAAADPSPQGPVMAPSGFDVTLHDILVEEQPFTGDLLVIVRVVAPAITSRVLAANLQADMEWICTEWGLPKAQSLASNPDQIVVELMAAPVPRGEPAPDVTQFFETYRPENGLCIWELF